jgi:hypothetical protein
MGEKFEKNFSGLGGLISSSLSSFKPSIFICNGKNALPVIQIL